jgi:hypothetical protein
MDQFSCRGIGRGNDKILSSGGKFHFYILSFRVRQRMVVFISDRVQDNNFIGVQRILFNKTLLVFFRIRKYQPGMPQCFLQSSFVKKQGVAFIQVGRYPGTLGSGETRRAKKSIGKDKVGPEFF